VAPASINHFCLPGWYDNYYECTGLLSPNGQYVNNMRWETTGSPVPIIDDISTYCDLAAVNWAIPDGLWSDHAGENNGSGPSYVANIVNAVGNSTCKDGSVPYWQDTAIFITWDDWGGWYDHVNPNRTGGPGVWQGTAPWGNWYTYGFRVPLLVVSAYTGTYNNGTWSGYVSGGCGTGTSYTCPNFGVNDNRKYVHDFGSILAFTEWNFGVEIGSIGQNGYPFADNYAPEWLYSSHKNVPLLDMFTPNGPRKFQPINIPPAYPLSYFQNYFTNNPNASPSGPDEGEGDQ